MEVLRTYLEMASPAELVPARSDAVHARVERVLECPSSFYRYLYAEVGRPHRWVDRLDWSDERIRQHLAQKALSLWVLYLAGTPAGYFELQGYDDGAVEIAYFGLLPEFKRRGLGKHLLTVAVEQAFGSGAKRVWLHTCTLDDPAAMPNYLARGFKPYREERYQFSE